MVTIKLLWMLIVGGVVLAILIYLFWSETAAMDHSGHPRVIEIDRSESFYDDDDCDDC